MNRRDINLRVPGPTPVPEEVAQAGAQPMINHRGPEFAEILGEIEERLAPFFGTEHDILLLTGSGTAGLEAALVNTLSPGDGVLAVTVGVFGDRFADIAEAFGADVHRLEGEWGRAAEPESVAEALARHPRTKAVLLTHNETSTGVTNDVAALARAIREASRASPLILVDGVSSIGGIPFLMDEWDVDVAITGSQKAWMSPPGLAMVAVRPRGWDAYKRARMPRYYWDLQKAQANARKGTMPFTPAVGVIASLREALRMMWEEEPSQVFARHARIGELVRESARSRGLELFPDPAVASNTVTALNVPEQVDASALRRGLRERGVVVADGQDRLKGRIFRLGHMGWVHDSDVTDLFGALDQVLDLQDPTPDVEASIR